MKKFMALGSSFKSHLGKSILVCTIVISSCGVAPSWAQVTNAHENSSAAQEAVKVVLKHFAINPLASDPNTHKPLRSDGSWLLSKTPPASCPDSAANCVEVIYSIPEQGARCTWVVALNADGSDETILGENDDADTYLVRTLSENETRPLVKTRVKPVMPPIAVAMHASGTVVTQVLVGKSGDVEHVSVASGPPVLQQASLDAARKWSVMPLVVGNRPVPYQFQIVFTYFPPIGSMAGAIKMAP